MNLVLPVLAGLTWLSAVVGIPMQGGPERQTPPASIDATGATDVTEELEGFIAGVADGSVIELPRKARYRIDGTLTIAARQDLTIEGNGTTLFATTEGDRNRAHVRIDGGSDLVVRDLIVVGANPEAGRGDDAYRADREAQHGFEVAGATRVELDSVGVTDVYGDSVYIGPGGNGTWSTQVWVHNSLFVRTGRQGISVTAGRDVVIERNHIAETRRATVDLEPNTPTQGARNIHILDNTVGRGRLLFVAAHGGGPVDDIVIADNVLRGRSLSISVTPPEGDRRKSFYVLGNTSDTPADRTPMTFVRIDGVVVRENNQPLVRRRAREGEVGVNATGVCSLEVVDNDFGDGTVPFMQRGSRCGERPALTPPAPPAIPARDEPAPPRSTTSTTSTTSAPEVAAPSTDVERDPSTNGIRWFYAVPVVATVALALGAVLVIRARRF